MSRVIVDFIGERVLLDHTFGVSRESYRELNCMFVALSDGEHVGLGEATEFMPDVYGSRIDEMLACAPVVRALVERIGLVHPREFHPHLLTAFPQRPFVRCAVDVAYWDLYARRLGQPLFRVLGFENCGLAESNYSIGLAPIAEMQSRAQRAANWPVFKIKLGRHDDIEIVRAIRAVTDKPIVVDANGGWSREEAERKVPVLADLGVVEIEQPLRADQWDAMHGLKRLSPVMLTADESCTSPVSLERCAGGFDKINAKLMKSGGITPVLDLFARAEQLGLRRMLGCMPESRVGVSAICQFAPAVESIEVDSVSFHVVEHADGVRIVDGVITLDDASSGTSARLIGAAAAALRHRGEACA